MKTGFRICGGHWLTLGLGFVLLGCGPEPVDGEPFAGPNRGPLYLPRSGAGGASSDSASSDSASSDSASSDSASSESDDPAVQGTTLSDSQNQPVCCRICVQGKACGDRCIDSEQACPADPGCACDG